MKFENLMSHSGVPKRYWYSKPKAKTSHIQYYEQDNEKPIMIKNTNQNKLVKSLLAGKFPERTIISSSPTDNNAMKLVGKIVANLFEKNYKSKVHAYDVSSDEIIGKHDLTIFYNIFSNSTEYRLQNVRDMIYKIQSPVIITVGGINPLEFSRDYLHITVDEVAYYRETL